MGIYLTFCNNYVIFDDWTGPLYFLAGIMRLLSNVDTHAE